jgi:hypothetical protein
LMNDNTKYVLSYSSSKRVTFKNNWNDSHYFTIVFSCLFLMRAEEFHDQKTMRISLQSYFKWALNHHNRV